MFTPFVKQEGFNPDSPNTANSPGNPPSPGPFDPSHFFGGTIFPDAFRNSKFNDTPSSIPDFDETLASMIAADPSPHSHHQQLNGQAHHPFHSSSTDSQQSYDPPPMDLRFPSQRDIHAAPSSFEAVRTFFRDPAPQRPTTTSQHQHQHSQSSSAPMDTSAIHNGEVYYDPSSNDYHHFSPSTGISMSRLLTSNLHLGGSARPDTPGSSVASPVESIFSAVGGLKKNSPPSPSRSRSRSRLSKSSITGGASKSRSARGKRTDSIASPPSPPLITPPSSVGSRPNAIVIPNSNLSASAAHPSSPLGLNIPSHPSTAPGGWFMPHDSSGYMTGGTGYPFGSLPNGQGLALPSPSSTIDTTQNRPPSDRAALLNEKRRRRRESHNAVERRRRDNINEKISELATLLPEGMLDPGAKDGDLVGGAKVESMFSPIGNGMSTGIILADEDGKEGPGLKANKGMILRKSVDYIRHLQQLVQAQAQRNRHLEGELKKYRPPGEGDFDSSSSDDPMAGLLLAQALSDVVGMSAAEKALLGEVDTMTLRLSPLPGSPPTLSERILRDIGASNGPDTSPSDRSGGGMDDEDEDGSAGRGRGRERSGGRFAHLQAMQRMEDESALSDGDGADQMEE